MVKHSTTAVQWPRRRQRKVTAGVVQVKFLSSLQKLKQTSILFNWFTLENAANKIMNGYTVQNLANTYCRKTTLSTREYHDYASTGNILQYQSVSCNTKEYLDKYVESGTATVWDYFNHRHASLYSHWVSTKCIPQSICLCRFIKHIKQQSYMATRSQTCLTYLFLKIYKANKEDWA